MRAGPGRGPRGREGWAGKVRLVACWGPTLPGSFRSLDPLVDAYQVPFSVVAVRWDGVRLRLLLWKQS